MIINKILCVLFLIFFGTLSSKEVSIILIRHGETDWNAEKRVQGHTDIPLNAKGIFQAKCTAEKIFFEHPNIVAIYSSDLSRAYDTACETAKKFGLPIVKSSAFREINTGESEGMLISEKIKIYGKKWEEINQKYSNIKEKWDHSSIPGEETINTLIKRIKNELLYIVQLCPDQGKIAIFSHGKALRSLIADIEMKELEEIELPNCGIVKLIYNSENLEKPFSIEKN